MDREYGVITYGSFIEETPEGFYYAERVRRTEEIRRAALSSLDRDLEDEVHKAVTRAVFYGTAD